MDTESIKQLANDVNNVVLATAKPYQEQIQQLKAKNKRQSNALDIAFKRLDTGGHHSFHKHFHGGCALCELEQALKG